MAFRGCRSCHHIYEVPDGKKVDNSHGYCPPCLRLMFVPTFKDQQAKEGNPTCYLESLGNCARTWCTYHPFCIKDLPTYADLQELHVRLAHRNENGQGKVHYC